MCLNKRFVKNQYTGRSVLVKCGHCAACMQEKANNRKLRLLNHRPAGYDVYFFHLTYEDGFLPFFYIDDICELDTKVNIYRRMDCDVAYNRKYNCLSLTYFYDYDNPDIKVSDFKVTKYTISELSALHEVSPDGRIGVLLYSDVQKFFKRLRSRLNRIPYVAQTLAKQPLYYFVVGEYGETYARPHWHILLYVPKFSQPGYGFEFFKHSVCSCWTYAYDYITAKRFEYAISPEKYVSQYVNCSSDVSTFLLRSEIRPKWHYSHNFGSFNPNFYLLSILQQVRSGHYEYIQRYPFRHGKYRDIALPLPEYITSRFFPGFKSRRSLSYSTMYTLVSNIAGNVPVDYPFTYDKSIKHDLIVKSILRLSVRSFSCSNIWQSDNYVARTLKISISDVPELRKRINRGYNLYLRVLRLPDNLANRLDYASDYVSCVKAKFRYLLSQQLKKTTERDILQSYDDIRILRDCRPDLFMSAFPCISLDSPFVVNPNMFDANLQRNFQLTDSYHKYVKTKKLNLCQKS